MIRLKKNMNKQLIKLKNKKILIILIQFKNYKLWIFWKGNYYLETKLNG